MIRREDKSLGAASITTISLGSGAVFELHTYVKVGEDQPKLNAILSLAYIIDREDRLRPLLERAMSDGTLSQRDIDTRRRERFEDVVHIRENTPLFQALPFMEDVASDTLMPISSVWARYQVEYTDLRVALALQGTTAKPQLKLPPCVPFLQDGLCILILDEEGYCHIKTFETSPLALGCVQWQKLDQGIQATRSRWSCLTSGRHCTRRHL